jgi:aminopeptidase N
MKMIRTLVYIGMIIFLMVSLRLIAQTDRVTYIDDPSWQVSDKEIDILHMTADLDLNPYDTSVTGSVSFLFKPMSARIDSFHLYVPDIGIRQADLDGTSVKYAKRGNSLIILPSAKLFRGNTYQLNLTYLAKPKYDLFHIGWMEPAIRKNKQIWAHRPFHWIPYVDDRLTVDMFITFNGQYMVFSNGVRESVRDNADGTKTWHYKMYREHPFFSTALVIGTYSYLIDTTLSGIPLELWYYPWNEDHAEPTYRYTAEMFSFLEEELGFSYPYELYRQAPVEDYLYGAMETTTSTVFGDYLAVDERAWDGRNYVNVNAHELTHQWFGNCLSHLRHRDVWLTESFATYFAKMFEKHVFGDDYYDMVRDQELQQTLQAGNRNGYPVGHSRGGRARWYPKGSLVLDMLRDVLGEEDFKASIRHYLEKNAFSEVETCEFLAAIREATGKSMEWFFDQWIYRGGEPEYRVAWSEAINAEGVSTTKIEVRQVHQRDDLVGLFNMPVNIDVFYSDGSSDRITPVIDEEYEVINLSNEDNKKVAFVLFDPGRRIVKKIEFQRTSEELFSQLLNAPLMIDRYDALLALRDTPVEQKKEILTQAWEEETFHLIRGEILSQLGPQNIQGWQNDDDPLLRRAVIQSVDLVPPGLQEEFEMFLTDRSYINVELGLDILCKSFPEKIPQYLERTKDEIGWRGMNIRMKWLEIAIGIGRQREYLDDLVNYAGPGYEFETRINAFQLLKYLNYMDKVAAFHLIDGYLYWNYKVSNAARDVLKYFYQQNQYKARIDDVLDEVKLAGDQKEKVKLMLGG